MILKLVLGLAAFVALLACITALGAAMVARRYPPQGRFVEVVGGRIHVLELGPKSDAPPVVLLHGVSGNLQDMRLTLGARLSQHHRVILIDRPGHGWSDRLGDVATPAQQAKIVAQALDALGIKRAIVVGYSWSGALAAAFALDFPECVAGLALLAPVLYPWPGGIAWHYNLASMPVIGTLFAHTIVLPVALPFIDGFTRGLFTPQAMPSTYVRDAAIPLVLRPQEFVANAQDVAALKESVTRQSPRYAQITTPTVIVAGDRDRIVSTEIHSRAMAATLPHAKLIVLPGVGHAVQHVATDVVVEEIGKLTVIPGKPRSGATRDP
jgi:pimeloyl-ACP methyl ester carboxylesterase